MTTVGFCPHCGAEVDISNEIRPFAYHECPDGIIGCIPIKKEFKSNRVYTSNKKEEDKEKEKTLYDF